MRRTCPRVMDCKAQQETGWYCPCRVRALLAEYAELLESGAAMKASHLAGIDRVQGKRPAYVAQEEQLCKKADIATTLCWLRATYPAHGLAVALSYGLTVDGSKVDFIGRRDGDGRLLTPPIKTVALLLAGQAAALTGAEPGRALPRRDLVRDLIGVGIEAMAYRLGWRPGLEG